MTSPASLFLTPTPDGRPYVSCAYIGREGSGKTHAACTWPNPVVVAFDHNRGSAEKHVGAERLIVPDSYEHFRLKILPAIKNRQLNRATLGFDVDTIILDTTSMAIQRLVAETPHDPKNKFAKWQLVKTNSRQDIGAVLSTTKPYPGDPSRPRYNVVLTWHLVPIWEGDEEKRTLVGYEPNFEGGFKIDLPSYTDCVFMSDVTTELRKDDKGAIVNSPFDGRPDRYNRYFIHTVAPDNFVKLKDGISGGKWKRLPARMDGSYQALSAAWGFPK